MAGRRGGVPGGLQSHAGLRLSSGPAGHVGHARHLVYECGHRRLWGGVPEAVHEHQQRAVHLLHGHGGRAAEGRRAAVLYPREHLPARGHSLCHLVVPGWRPHRPETHGGLLAGHAEPLHRLLHLCPRQFRACGGEFGEHLLRRGGLNGPGGRRKHRAHGRREHRTHGRREHRGDWHLRRVFHGPHRPRTDLSSGHPGLHGRRVESRAHLCQKRPVHQHFRHDAELHGRIGEHLGQRGHHIKERSGPSTLWGRRSTLCGGPRRTRQLSVHHCGRGPAGRTHGEAGCDRRCRRKRGGVYGHGAHWPTGAHGRCRGKRGGINSDWTLWQAGSHGRCRGKRGCLYSHWACGGGGAHWHCRGKRGCLYSHWTCGPDRTDGPRRNAGPRRRHGRHRTAPGPEPGLQRHPFTERHRLWTDEGPAERAGR